MATAAATKVNATTRPSLGRRFFANPAAQAAVFGAVLVCSISLVAAANVGSDLLASEKVSAERGAALRATSDAHDAACRADREGIVARAKAALAKDPAGAARELERCWRALADDETKPLRNQALTRVHLLAAQDKSKSTEDRLEALRKVGLFDAAEAKRQAPLHASLTKTLNAERAAVARAEAAAKRKAGVSLGMSQADALASSWGKPSRVNRTHNVYGTREQWVYDDSRRGYLYFTDGILTSVQN